MPEPIDDDLHPVDEPSATKEQHLGLQEGDNFFTWGNPNDKSSKISDFWLEKVWFNYQQLETNISSTEDSLKCQIYTKLPNLKAGD